MKILMLNYEFPPLGGGGGVAAKKLAKGFVEKGHEVDYLTSYHSGLEKKEEIKGINVYRVEVGRRKINTASKHSLIFYPITGFLKAIKLCIKNEYDLINTHFAIPSGPLGVIISKIFNIKNILTIHGADIHDPTRTSPHEKVSLKKAVEFSIKNSDKIVAQSNNTKENTKKYYNIEGKQIKVIPLPYEPYDFEDLTREELELEKEKHYIISVGRLVKRKNYEYLIKAISRIKNRNIEALIIGSGPLKSKLERKAEELGISNRITLLGYMEEEKKFQYLNEADLYVLSSIHEGFGIVLQEAMQVGLPLISTNNGGQTDFITNDRNGYLIPPENSEILAGKIEELLNKPKKRKKFEKNNLDKIKDFKTKKICKWYLNLVKK